MDVSIHMNNEGPFHVVQIEATTPIGQIPKDEIALSLSYLMYELTRSWEGAEMMLLLIGHAIQLNKNKDIKPKTTEYFTQEAEPQQKQGEA